jgi:phosphatidyl-myo-inositol alpha-mannosyltransferase
VTDPGGVARVPSHPDLPSTVPPTPDRSLRIALVAEDYYPQLGGIPEHVHHLALELQARGHTALVVASQMRGDSGDPPFVHRIGRSVVIYANGGVSRITVGWRLTARLADLLREHRIDLVHVHGGLWPTFGLVAPWAARRVGIPVVATSHSWFPRSIGLRVFRRPLQRILDQHAALLAVSRPVIEVMSRYFRGTWELVPNGVDISYFQPNGRRPGDALVAGPRLLFLHRLEPRNRLGIVLDAMPFILKRFPNALLNVVGDGPWRGYYERRARALGGRVRFLGRVFDRPVHYGSADIYLCPSVRASFGVTLLEAMACGTPLILSDNVGFRSVADDGREAVIVTRNDPRSWADAAIALLEDPERRAQMSQLGLLKAARYAWPRVAEQTLAVYRRVLEGSCPKP